jgi:hypothetical protein
MMKYGINYRERRCTSDASFTGKLIYIKTCKHYEVITLKDLPKNEIKPGRMGNPSGLLGAMVW